jgi:hypothetical protein
MASHINDICLLAEGVLVPFCAVLDAAGVDVGDGFHADPLIVAVVQEREVQVKLGHPVTRQFQPACLKNVLDDLDEMKEKEGRRKKDCACAGAAGPAPLALTTASPF